MNAPTALPAGNGATLSDPDDPVVITGTGLVSALGCDAAAALASIAAGGSGIATVESFTRPARAALVREFTPTDYVAKAKLRRMDPLNVFAIGAATQALAMAGLDEAGRLGCGAVVGSGFAGYRSVVEHQKKLVRDGIRTLSPIHFPTTVYNATAGLLAIELQVLGPNSTVTGVDASGEHALYYAATLLARGQCEQILAIGADELSPALFDGFDALGLLERDTTRSPLPFGRERHGFAPGEGAAALLLERESTARARGATILGRLLGFGFANGASTPFAHNPDPALIATAATEALGRARLTAGQIDWCSASACGSPTRDAAEAAGLASLFAAHGTPLRALKAWTGEYAASGIQRLLLGLHAARLGALPAMPAGDYLPEVAPLLAADCAAPRRCLHLGTGVGGNTVAIVVEAAATGRDREAT